MNPAQVTTSIESEIPTQLWEAPAVVGPGYPPSVPQLTQFDIHNVNTFAECITLHNIDVHPADFGGWTVGDGEGSYRFPEGTIVQGGATYKVCMQSYNPTHYTRGLYLNNKHDQVYLYNPDFVLQDEVT